MRSGVTVIITFLCCILSIVTILTVGSFTLQRDEIERAMDFTAKQTARQCIEEGIENKSEIEATLANTFTSQINSKNGTLILYVLHADENIVDIASDFVYTQINGSEKRISCRKTYIKDWEEDKEEESEFRFINDKYASQTPENGGLKRFSVWKYDNMLETVLENEQLEDGSWRQYEKIFEIKVEK